MTAKDMLAAALAVALMTGGAVPSPAEPAFGIPEPIAAGHDEIYERMEAATEAGGAVGEAAIAVMEVLGPHFRKEEEYALPQLGLLPRLAGPPFGGEAGPLTAEEREELLARTERLRAELPAMLEEHREIEARLEDLRQTATREGRPEIARLADEILTHARLEEETLYPAALLAGDHARLRARGAGD